MKMQGISIGKDKWIDWVYLDVDNENLFDIDYLLEPLEIFWQYLETDCVAGCCGIDAFSFWPEDIKHAAEQFNRSSLSRKLYGIISAIEQSKNSVVTSRRLNIVFDSRVFIQLIKHIISHL